MFFLSYARVVFTEPGYPPEGTPLDVPPPSTTDSSTNHEENFQPQQLQPASSSFSGDEHMRHDGRHTEITELTPIHVPAQSSQHAFHDPPPETTLTIDPSLVTVTAKRNGQPRYCQKCQCQKPDRTHHCSACGQCVLKMDHHCPWINNCVGFFNQKFFYLFLFWGTILSLWVFITCAIEVGRYFNDLSAQNAKNGGGANGWFRLLFNNLFILYLLTFDLDVRGSLQILFLAVIGAVFSLSLGAFTGIHTHYILNNLTTIESFEKHRYKASIRHLDDGQRARYMNVFDLGRSHNWRLVMGRDWRWWFLPIATTPGTGIVFPMRIGAIEGGE